MKYKYYEHLFRKKWTQLNKFDTIIYKYSQKYCVSPFLLKSIIVIEQINRGHWLLNTAEKIIAKFFNKYLIQKDFSIGLCQIKPSTAKTVFPKISHEKISLILLKQESNIHICAKILAPYNFKSIEEIILLYTTGSTNKNYLKNPAIKLYINLCKIGMQNNFDHLPE